MKTNKQKYQKKLREKNKEKYSEYMKQYYIKNKEQINQVTRNSRLKRKYGISETEYNILFKEQGGVCAICGTSSPGGIKKKFCIDHSHTTNKVRGLVCHSCNLMLGYAYDNINILREGIEYLEKSNN